MTLVLSNIRIHKLPVELAPEHSSTAIDYYTQLATLLPDEQFPQKRLLNLLLQANQYEEVIRRVDEAPPADDPVLPIRCKAQALVGLKRWKDAIQLLNEFQQTGVVNPLIQKDLAVLLARVPDDSLRDGTKSHELADRAIAGVPTPTWFFRYAKITALAELGRFAEAVVLFDESKDLLSNESDAAKAEAERLKECLDAQRPYRYEP